MARYRYVCGVDADTVFAPDALLKGMRLVVSDPARVIGVTSHLTIALDPEAIARAIQPNTVLISVMTANNEVGTVQPIAEIGAIARTHGIAFHTDAVQAGGAIALDACEYWAQSGVVVATATEVARGIADLAARLQSATAAYRIGTRAEPPWRPHVTLARKVLQPPVLPAMSTISWTARSFALMSSQRHERRSVYTVVDTWPLLDRLTAAKISSKSTDLR